jgi:predicted 2-oxoglutarate/Fe(II)-dependent dioxygenase YbiX
MQVEKLGGGVFKIYDYLSTAECSDYIAESERLGYAEAAIRTDAGDQIDKDARNNDRIIHDNPALANRLYARAEPLLAPKLDGASIVGFNERLRFYRYDKSQQFVWHQDGRVRLTDSIESHLTFLIYLNDDFKGGRTDFVWESVKPVRGMALVFPHQLRHRGAVVEAGQKYVLRTDVLYEWRD